MLAHPQPHRRTGPHDHLGVFLVKRDHTFGKKFSVKQREQQLDIAGLRHEQLRHPSVPKLFVEIRQRQWCGQTLAQPVAELADHVQQGSDHRQT